MPKNSRIVEIYLIRSVTEYYSEPWKANYVLLADALGRHLHTSPVWEMNCLHLYDNLLNIKGNTCRDYQGCMN